MTLNYVKVSWIFTFQFLSLLKMKKKFAILNSFLAIAVLFSMLFQFVHSSEHLAKQLSEKECHHKYTSNQEITHQHHVDDCFVCHFSVSSFITTGIHRFEFSTNPVFSKVTLFRSLEITQFFKGSLFALRAPPTI